MVSCGRVVSKGTQVIRDMFCVGFALTITGGWFIARGNIEGGASILNSCIAVVFTPSALASYNAGTEHGGFSLLISRGGDNSAMGKIWHMWHAHPGSRWR